MLACCLNIHSSSHPQRQHQHSVQQAVLCSLSKMKQGYYLSAMKSVKQSLTHLPQYKQGLVDVGGFLEHGPLTLGVLEAPYTSLRAA
eukprot:1161365-Pelagomonas_calceolata.AAC.5